jgi:5-methylcytosine-specific restriction enzyme subunit McrC
MIPISNLYYLLCYAWGRLDERDFVDIDATSFRDLPNLIGRLLISGVKRLLRRGVHRDYLSFQEDSENPRGKIDISDSIKRAVIWRNSVTCIVDDLSRNVLQNQIIRTTLNRLARAKEIDAGLSHELNSLVRQLDGVALIELQPHHFLRIQIHRNNAFYRFLLHICELCFHSLLADEKGGEYRFKDFVRDEDRMRKLFQDFVFNFFEIEQREFKISSERFNWDIESGDFDARRLLPDMITDVCLTNETRKIVIECKFSKDTLQENRGKLSARSEHLYQLFAYLKNLEQRGGTNVHCDGLLLYPATGQLIDFMFVTQGHKVRVATLDLTKDWIEIRHSLLGFLNPWENGYQPQTLVVT